MRRNGRSRREAEEVQADMKPETKAAKHNDQEKNSLIQGCHRGDYDVHYTSILGRDAV
jgi:hypothetical protein